VTRLLLWLLKLDRRWIFLFVLVSVATPIVFPIGLPVTTTDATRRVFEYMEGLKPGDTVWISFDYGPSSAPVMRQCFLKHVKVVVLALYPLGGLGLMNTAVEKVTAEFPGLKYGVDYVNLGYKDGAAAVMRRLGEDIAGAFPTDVRGTPLSQIPMLKDVHNIRNVKLVFTAATGVIGEWWITQVHSQIGTPVAIGPTAVSAPKYYAYLNAGQLVGMLSGMKGAAEYERLLRDTYPQMARFYKSTRTFTATKGMDGQTVIHTVIIFFILLGNFAFLATRRARRTEAAG
jgi:hypothetical protein